MHQRSRFDFLFNANKYEARTKKHFKTCKVEYKDQPDIIVFENSTHEKSGPCQKIGSVTKFRNNLIVVVEVVFLYSATGFKSVSV